MPQKNEVYEYTAINTMQASPLVLKFDILDYRICENPTSSNTKFATYHDHDDPDLKKILT